MNWVYTKVDKFKGLKLEKLFYGKNIIVVILSYNIRINLNCGICYFKLYMKEPGIKIEIVNMFKEDPIFMMRYSIFNIRKVLLGLMFEIPEIILYFNMYVSRKLLHIEHVINI